MRSHSAMIARWKKAPTSKAEHDALEEEFAMFDELLKARRAAKLTQSEVAKRMGTKVPAISRMESSGGGKKHSPSIRHPTKIRGRRRLPPRGQARTRRSAEGQERLVRGSPLAAPGLM